MISWNKIKTKMLLFVYNLLAGDNDKCEVVRKNTLTAMSQALLNSGDQIGILSTKIAEYNNIKHELLKMADNREWHITELDNTLPGSLYRKEMITMSANHILGQMQDIMNGKGYNPERRWVVFTPAMSIHNERTLHDKQ